MNIEITGVEEVNRGLIRMKQEVSKAVPDKLKMAAVDTEATMKKEAPIQTGSLVRSIETTIKKGTDYTAEIGPSNKYFNNRPVGLTVEEGRRAGSPPPPYTALMARYGLTVGQAIKAAQTISQRGVVPNPFVSRTLKRVQTTFPKYGIDAVKQIVNKF